MKMLPDLEREYASRGSLGLLDTLLAVADNVRLVLVMEMLQVPKSYCPDILTLG